MSEKVSTKQVTAESSHEAIANESQNVEAYADRLLDDVFQDVDRVLDGGFELPKQPTQPESISLKSIQVPQIVLPTMTLPGRDSKSEQDDKQTVTVETQAQKQQRSDRLFDRLLLGTACVSLLVAMGLWLGSRGELQRWFGIQSPAAQPSEPEKSPKELADEKFAQYMRQSLDAIERQDDPAPTQASASIPDVPPAPQLPTLSIPVNPASSETMVQSLNRIALALERVAPPLAQTPTPPKPDEQTAQAQPSPSASPSSEESSAEASPTPSGNATVAQTPSPAPPPPPPSAESPAEASPTPTTASTQVHTLVGILELGDNRSAALFEIDGVARRVRVGEQIGASGWTLVEVANQQAMIRRNGEVRSVYVGQQF
jgi:hypothetical protein